MISLKSTGTTASASVLSAFAASLCCITPAIALLAGSSSIAANFSWIEPARPYLIGLSVLVLSFAWYQQLKPVAISQQDCNCAPTKVSFFQSKMFLAIVTVFAILMMTFPLYADRFYQKQNAQIASVAAIPHSQQVKFAIQGMTCAACEQHVNTELAKVNGVSAFQTSYSSRSSIVTYDSSQVDVKAIGEAINKTGYKVTRYHQLSVDSPSKQKQ